jgi:hypothetical protein
MSDRLTKEQLEARGLVLAGMVDQEATIAALRAELEKARVKPTLTDEVAAQVMWVKLCCVQPVGCGDGGTYVVSPPTQSEFVAVVAPALAKLRAERDSAHVLLKDLAEWNDWHDELPEHFRARIAKEIGQ